MREPTRPMSATGPAGRMTAAGASARHRRSPTAAGNSRTGKINTTDLDSRMVKGQHGWLQGYNAQAAPTSSGSCIAAEIKVVSPDFGHLEPMVTAARRELASGRRHRHAEGGARRLRLLAHRADAPPRRPRHPGPDPARIRAAQARGRAGTAASTPSCAASLRPSTAPRSTANANTDRVPVRPHQIQPRHRPLPPPRQSRRPHRMATDHRHPQPLEALATHHCTAAGRRA